MPRHSCSTPSINDTCSVLFPYEEYEVRPEGIQGVPAHCTGSGFSPGPCVDYGNDDCSSVGMITCGESCVLPGSVLTCAQIFEGTGRCPSHHNYFDPTNCQYVPEVVAIPPGQPTGRPRQELTEVWTEHSCETYVSGNTWRADECVDPLSDTVGWRTNRTDPETCEFDVSG